MFDHVTIRVSDLAVGREFYGRVLGLLEYPRQPSEGEGFVEWNDFSIAAASADEPVTRRLHIGFAAGSHEQVDAWWRAMTAAGAQSDGEPGPRPEYGSEYYGAFILDADGNSVEAVTNGPPRGDGGVIDHLWLRVRSLADARAFYEVAGRVVGFATKPLPGRVHFHRGPTGTFSVARGERTENVHIAFAVPGRAPVDEFHETLVAAGYRDNGPPGERPVYHPGYYGAFVLDPDGNNVEAVFHDR